jgi:hypothetical protein
MAGEKQKVEVLFTPKVLLSEEPLTSATSRSILKDLYSKIKEYERSRAHLLRKISANSRVAGTKSFAAASSIGLLNKDISIASPNHQPDSTLTISSGQMSRPAIIDNPKDHSSEIVTILKKSNRRINFNEKVCVQNLSTNHLLYTNHIPANVRIRVVESLLQIRDDIIEIVTFLQATGFGGKDFTWSPSFLKAYGITRIPSLRIPKEFRGFVAVE